MPLLASRPPRRPDFSHWAKGWIPALPSQCAICRAWPTQPVCDACVTRFAQPVARCRGCALRVPTDIEYCGECLRHGPVVDHCVATCDYAWPWTACIASFKFNGQPGWAGPLAALMRATPYAEPLLESADVVLPMPLSANRLSARGFNQSLELARRLSPAKCDPTLLLRIRDTRAQSALNREQRLRNLRGAFAIDPLRAHQVDAARVLLVDDVMTTGASIATLAQVLRAAGARRISALVFARTAAPD